MELFLIPFAATGAVVLLRLSGIKLPNFKPFNCVYCLATWIAIGLAITQLHPYTNSLLINLVIAWGQVAIVAFCTPLVVIAVLAHAPWIFED